MKNVLKLTLFSLILVFVLAVSANAAEHKLGHINTAELLKSMPEVQAADLKVQEYAKQMEDMLKSMTTEYQTKVSDFQAKQSTFSEAIRDAKIKEVQDIERRIQEFQQKAQEDINKEREKNYAPILQKASEAIKSVAKEKGLSYVLDISQPGVLYSDGGEDLMDLVRQKLNLNKPLLSPAMAPTSIDSAKPAKGAVKK